jgi:hypothetical protein
MRSLPANCTLVAFFKILGTFSKALIHRQLRITPFLAYYQKGFLTKNSLENFSSESLFHHIRNRFSSDQKPFLRVTTSVFDRFISIFLMRQSSFVSFCPRFSL